MFTRPGRLIAHVASVLVLVAAATVAYLLLPPRQTGDVAVPAPHATPEQVVTAYLDALKAHDCDTAEAVMAEGAKDKSWCEKVATLTGVDVKHHVMEPPEYSGRTAPEEVANVPVAFNVNWRPLRNDNSMDEGPTTWGYLLVRDSASSPWRIVDQGTG